MGVDDLPADREPHAHVARLRRKEGVECAIPVLFALGMSLVDTTDGVLMLGAYDRAFVRPKSCSC
jgi:hypothetical protein